MIKDPKVGDRVHVYGNILDGRTWICTTYVGIKGIITAIGVSYAPPGAIAVELDDPLFGGDIKKIVVSVGQCKRLKNTCQYVWIQKNVLEQFQTGKVLAHTTNVLNHDPIVSCSATLAEGQWIKFKRLK